MAVLSVSRQFGAGGWTLGKAVADRLGYKFVSSRIINEIAKETNVSVEWIKGVDKHAGDRLMRHLAKIVDSSFIDRHVGDSKTDFDEKKFISFLQKIVNRIADEDNTVILGRGSQFILQDRKNVFRLLIVADLKDRIEFIEKSWNISRKEAEKAIRKREKQRDAFLKYFKQGHPNSLNLYHVIINTSKMDFDQAEDLITYMVKSFEEKINA